MKLYKFRREDNQKIVEVPFGVMMGQDAAGFITLPCGTLARRCAYLEEEEPAPAPPQRRGQHTGTRKIVSDSLGFPRQQLADFERDRKANGFGGVEFAPDPAVPEFVQVHCDSRATFNRYAKHRGMVNKNTFGGVLLSTEEMERAETIARRIYPC